MNIFPETPQALLKKIAELSNGADEIVWKELIELYAPALRLFVKLRDSNLPDADVEDVVQEVFVRWLDTKPVFASVEHEKAWFIRSTINRCRDIYRKNSLRNHEDISEMENLVHTEDISDEAKDVLSAVEQLPEKIKNVVILHYLEGLSVEMTAKTLKISSSAVKMRLSRGRLLLKDILEKEGFNV